MSTAEILFIGYGFVFTVMLFLSIKQWRWFHVFISFLLIISSLLFTQVSSYVLDFRQRAAASYQAAVNERDGHQDDINLILHGLEADKARASGDSLVSLRRQLERALEGRGRVWENAPLSDVQGNPAIAGTTATVTLPNDAHGIEAGTRLFAFTEMEIDHAAAPAAPAEPTDGPPGVAPAAAPAQAEKIKVPAVYLGEYDVDTVNGAAITIKCAFAPRVFNPANIANGLTVALYDSMPKDSHFKFASRAADKYDQLAQGGLDNSEPLFGEMDNENITQLFRTAVQPLVQNQLIINHDNEILAKRAINLLPLGNKLVEEFVADGRPLNGREVDPKNIWYKLQFTTKTTLTQKVNGDDAQAALTEAGVFQAGEAISPLFYHKSPTEISYNEMTGATQISPGKATDSIEFDVNDIAYIAAAEKIVQENRIVPVEVLVSGAEGVDPVARRIVDYFVRPLHDYNHTFHAYEARLQTLAFSDDNARHDITATTAARNDVQVQINYRKQEKKELELDLELHRRDEHEADLYSQALQAEVERLTASLAEIFDRNQTLAQTLTDRQQQLEEAIDARTEEAENAAGNSEE